MKIPETTANVGAYYANEENGQWQPNGVIIDSGVGGGVVGSGDAGVHRAPVYPVHVPRGHIPGPYVMAGAYYPPGTYPATAAPQDDFADYMWMENEEEFDKQVMQQLEEEALMEQCIEAMLEDEQREQRQRPVSNGHNHYPTTSNGQGSLSLEETVSRSTLNPLAAEFVPNRARPPTEEITETQQQQPQQQAEQQATESKTEVESSKEKEQMDTESKKDSKVEEPPQPTEPPEVSAADVQPIDDKEKIKETKKDTKKPEVKKNLKTEVKKTKPIPVKEKLEKKKSLKEESVEVKQSSPQPDDTGIKPINYAAAAKAMKPKKPTSPTAEPQPAVTTEKKKDKPKTDKPIVQRKNSAK